LIDERTGPGLKPRLELVLNRCGEADGAGLGKISETIGLPGRGGSLFDRWIRQSLEPDSTQLNSMRSISSALVEKINSKSFQLFHHPCPC
jgi:hypothetical protein